MYRILATKNGAEVRLGTDPTFGGQIRLYRAIGAIIQTRTAQGWEDV